MDPYHSYDEISSSDSDDFDMGNSPEHPPAVVPAIDVDDENSSSVTEESPHVESLGLCTFDRGLPCQHSYLGSDLEVLRGRTLLDDGSFHTLDMLHPNGVVLVPGQTLPLTVHDPRTISMLQRCIAKDHTFGVFCKWIPENNRKYIDNIGTTAEIYEYQAEEGHDGFRIKAKGRQRFKIIKAHTHYYGITATVKILPEVCLPDALEGVRTVSLNRHRTAHPLRCRKRDAMLTAWPEWVYRQYETKRLISKIKEQLTFLEQGQQNTGTKINIPENPTELSFWVAHNLPIHEDQVIFLLKLNSPIQRLRWELSVLHKLQVLCCNRCKNQVGSHKDAFSMSVEGPQGTYVNPGGYVHETITLYKVEYVYAVGPPSTEFSWFPGYAWSIAKCRQCYKHMGWKFTATSDKLMPKEFWGLCRGSLIVQLDNEVNNVEEHVHLVF